MEQGEKEKRSTLDEIWSRVRKKHYYPELGGPTSTDSMEGVAIEIKSKQITLSNDFIDKMAENLPKETVIEALLDHGVTHYTYCPWDFNTYLNLYREAKKIFKEKDMAEKTTEYFMDVVADTHCFKTKETPLPQLYRHMKGGLLDEVVHSLYQRIWGEDLNVQGHEEISRKLSRIPYLNRNTWTESIQRFSKAIKVLMEEEKKDGNMDQPNPMGENSLDRYSNEEIDQGLKEFAVSSGEPGRFRDILKDFEEELKDSDYLSRDGMGLGAGSDLDADLLYYMKLAENYSLPIKRTPIEKSGSLFPYGHLPWEIGKPVQDIDPWTSFGKIMPGMTQMWERRQGETHGEEEDTPNCIVMIDSSGSMVNPKQYLSHAVLGAACASDSYLRNDASVAVYNFSDVESGGRQILDFTRQRKLVYRSLCHYFGGGTRLNMKDLDGFRDDKTTPDIFLITDMQITNLEAMIKYMQDLPNRITAVHIGDNDHVRRFRKSMGTRANLSIFTITRKEDIPRIVLGKVREYLGAV